MSWNWCPSACPLGWLLRAQGALWPIQAVPQQLRALGQMRHICSSQGPGTLHDLQGPAFHNTLGGLGGSCAVRCIHALLQLGPCRSRAAPDGRAAHPDLRAMEAPGTAALLLGTFAGHFYLPRWQRAAGPSRAGGKGTLEALRTGGGPWAERAWPTQCGSDLAPGRVHGGVVSGRAPVGPLPALGSPSRHWRRGSRPPASRRLAAGPGGAGPGPRSSYRAGAAGAGQRWSVWCW